jgi:ubiquitin-protein ligase
VKFEFTEEFPAAPPKCKVAVPRIWSPGSCHRSGRFTTKIFHPNVSSAGEICVSTLKKDWKPSYGIGHILVTIKCLLIYPNPDSALDEEAGKLLQENYESYCERAKLITSVHATPKVCLVTQSRGNCESKYRLLPRSLHQNSLRRQLKSRCRMRLHLLWLRFHPRPPYHLCRHLPWSHHRKALTR